VTGNIPLFESRTLRFDTAVIALLEETHDASICELASKMTSNNYSSRLVTDIITCALVGGGLSLNEASDLMAERIETADFRSLAALAARLVHPLLFRSTNCA
jgi:hypothetical protein